MEVMKDMTAKEVLNLIEWLREQGFDNDKIVECIEAIGGKKKGEHLGAVQDMGMIDLL